MFVFKIFKKRQSEKRFEPFSDFYKKHILECESAIVLSGKPQKVWIDKSHYRVHKVEFYDKKGALLKVLELKDYELYKEKYWRPIRSEMTNVQTRKSTSLITESLIFDTDLSESDFDKNSLKRAR